MNERHRFFILDVFGERRYSGNQLATVMDAADIPGGEMQQIAREFGFSETTFVLSNHPVNGAYPVRIFTPAAELDFAGHPTLGTAFVLRHHLAGTTNGEIVLGLGVGRVRVRLSENEEDLLWMEQEAPRFDQTLAPGPVARVLGIDEEDIDTRWPVEEVSTGLPCVIVPLRSMVALKRVKVQRDLYDRLVDGAFARVILAFAPGGYSPQQALGVRVFPIALGIPEDPATGSGSGCLGAYLVRHGVLGPGPVDLAVGQGYEIGRPSTVFVRAARGPDRIDVEVGGRVIGIAEGRWG